MAVRKWAGAAAFSGGLLPQWAMAHESATHGFLHPFVGADHWLAMLLVGLLAARLGGRALVALPLSFLALMAAGGAAGMAGFGLPFVETAIALSVIALGAALAFAVRAPVGGAMLFVGGFAIFHGLAHGAEMPAGSGAAGYAVGFLAATALLHAAGVALGLGFGHLAGRPGQILLRSGGAAAALAAWAGSPESADLAPRTLFVCRQALTCL